MNEYVTECNRTGHIISAEERENIQHLRILTVLKCDDTVRAMFAGHLYDTIRERNCRP